MTRTRQLLLRTSLLAISLSPLLSGCTNMSGLDGSAEYGCKAPLGVHCDSVSGNYYNAIQNNLPGQRRQAAKTGTEAARNIPPDTTSASPSAISLMAAIPDKAGPDAAFPPALTAPPLRSPARVLRLWFKPWEDADHDLVDQGFVYVQIDGGSWLIDHAQQRIRDAYAPIRPPHAETQPATAPAKPDDSRSTSIVPSVLPVPVKPSPNASDQPGDDKP